MKKRKNYNQEIITKVHNRNESHGYGPPQMPWILCVCAIGSHQIAAKRKWAQLWALCAVWHWCGKMEGVSTASHRQAYLSTFEWSLWTWTLTIEWCGVNLKIHQVCWNSDNMWSCWIPSVGNPSHHINTTSLSHVDHQQIQNICWVLSYACSWPTSSELNAWHPPSCLLQLFFWLSFTLFLSDVLISYPILQDDILNDCNDFHPLLSPDTASTLSLTTSNNFININIALNDCHHLWYDPFCSIITDANLSSIEDCLTDLYGTSTFFRCLSTSLLTIHLLAPNCTLGLESCTQGYTQVPLTMHPEWFMMERGWQVVEERIVVQVGQGHASMCFYSSNDHSPAKTPSRSDAKGGSLAHRYSGTILLVHADTGLSSVLHVFHI